MPVTVLIPIRNGHKHLLQLRSNLTANLRDSDEILIVDDGSEDKTPQFVKVWAEEDSRVNFISNPNHGLANALNLGVRQARNEFIARLDVDDLISIERVELQEKLLRSRDVCAIFSDAWVIDEEDVLKGRVFSPILEPLIALSLTSNRRLPHSSVMFRRDCIIKAGGYSQLMYPIEDLDLWLRLIRNYNVISVEVPLIFYRRGKNSVTSLNRNLMREKRKLLIQNSDYILENYKFVLEEWFHLRKLLKSEENFRTRIIYSLIDLIETSKYFSKQHRLRFSLFSILFLETVNLANLLAFYNVFRNITSIRSE